MIDVAIGNALQLRDGRHVVAALQKRFGEVLSTDLKVTVDSLVNDRLLDFDTLSTILEDGSPRQLERAVISAMQRQYELRRERIASVSDLRSLRSGNPDGIGLSRDEEETLWRLLADGRIDPQELVYAYQHNDVRWIVEEIERRTIERRREQIQERAFE
jgi:hypothetical protein